MTRFYAENSGSAMEPDGLSSSRPINAGLESNTTNIMTLFDAISYHKVCHLLFFMTLIDQFLAKLKAFQAAAIIHMVQGLTGEWYFQKVGF